MASRPPIDIREYKNLPDGTDTHHGLSIVNLTEDEARQIAVFVRELGRASEARERAERMQRAEAVTVSQLTGSWMSAAMEADLVQQRAHESAAREQRMQRANAVLKLKSMVDDAVEDSIRDAARQPEPTDADAAGEPPNRFSGLDFE